MASSPTSYQLILQWMYRRLPMYQRLGAAAMRPGLNNILTLCAHFNQPQHSFKSIHIAGTNGKGSVSHGLSAVFQTAGYKTGLYTSPHLKSFRERIRVNGNKITKKAVVDFIKTHQAFFEQGSYSFFEITFVMALWYFRQQQVQVAII
ncbi:MAG: bifunctional folylpolyglutamate synthase/dihydrofolate synthase, partial [Flavobacteriaceae bacterium]|nr:bifunctional folylpolyglutamate synthase/dihydrofolate synthase [Flavobacteriaceae bacterium]